jgi:hypothetical protein
MRNSCFALLLRQRQFRKRCQGGKQYLPSNSRSGGVFPSRVRLRTGTAGEDG